MPIIKSAIKRVRLESRRTKRNLITKNQYKALIKDFTKLVDEKKLKEAGELFPLVQKSIDMAAKKNQLHKNNAARKKSSLAKMLGDTPAPKAAAKPAAKKAPAKKDS